MFVPTIKYKRASEPKAVISPADNDYNNAGENETAPTVSSSSCGNLGLANDLSQSDKQKIECEEDDMKQKKAKITTGFVDKETDIAKITAGINGVTFEEEKEKSTPTIIIDPEDDERILVTLSDGKTQYTADRYCPHAGADLSYLGQVDEDEYPAEIGPILLCTLHYWEYALKREGRGANGVATINACPVTSSVICHAKKELDW